MEIGVNMFGQCYLCYRGMDYKGVCEYCIDKLTEKELVMSKDKNIHVEVFEECEIVTDPKGTAGFSSKIFKRGETYRIWQSDTEENKVCLVCTYDNEQYYHPRLIEKAVIFEYFLKGKLNFTEVEE